MEIESNSRCCGNLDNSSNSNTVWNSFTSCFFSLPPKQFALLASLLGILLTDNLDLDRQNSLGNFFQSIGQSMLTSAAQAQTLQSDNQKKDHLRRQIEAIKEQLHALEQELD